MLPDLTYLSWAAEEITRIVNDERHLNELEPRRLSWAQEQFEKYSNLVGGIFLRDQISTKKIGEVRTSLYREFVVDRFPVQIGKPTITAKYFILKFARGKNPPQEILVMPLFDRTISVRPVKRFQGKRIRTEGERVPKIIYNDEYKYLDFLAQITMFLLQSGFIKNRGTLAAEKIFQKYVEEKFPELNSSIDFDNDTDDILRKSFKWVVGGYYNPVPIRVEMTRRLSGPVTEKTKTESAMDRLELLVKEKMGSNPGVPYSEILNAVQVENRTLAMAAAKELRDRKLISHPFLSFQSYVNSTLRGALNQVSVKSPPHFVDETENEDREVDDLFNPKEHDDPWLIKAMTKSMTKTEEKGDNDFDEMPSLNDGIRVLFVAKKLSISRSNIYRWIREGEIPASKTYSHKDKHGHLVLTPDCIKALERKVEDAKLKKKLINCTQKRRKIAPDSARKWIYRKLKDGLSPEEILSKLP